MEIQYRKLNNPVRPTGKYCFKNAEKSNYRAPGVDDIVSVTTTGKIYILIQIEYLDRDVIRGEIVGIGPTAGAVTGTINHDNWSITDKIEIEHPWIDSITYHEKVR